jgi:hypothetical protein
MLLGKDICQRLERRVVLKYLNKKFIELEKEDKEK